MKKITAILVLLAFSSMLGVAQTQKPVTDNEMKQFSSALKEIQAIDQQVQQKMINAIEDNGMDVEQFNQINQAEQNPELEADATDEELSVYRDVVKDLQQIQEKTEQKMQGKIEEEGLSLNRYQEISLAIQEDPDLQRKLQEYMQE